VVRQGLNSTEVQNNEKLILETLVRCVGANIQAMIHIIVYGLKKAENLYKGMKS